MTDTARATLAAVTPIEIVLDIEGMTCASCVNRIERFLRATHKGWRDAHGNPAEAIDSMTSVVPGLDRDALVATTPQIMDLCITDRSRKNGIGWIEPELMQRTIDITFAQAKPDKPVKAEDVFTNAFNSKIKPLK